MTKENRSSTIHKLSIGLELSLDEVEEALSGATREAMVAGVKTEEVKMDRVELMKDETLVFFRGDRIVAYGLKTILKKKSPKAKITATKTTAAALAKVR